MNNNPIYLSVIQTDDKIYIKDENNYYSVIPKLFFDGEKAETTYKKEWYVLKQMPEKIQQQTPDQRINIRYELKAGYPESELTPKVINYSSLYDTKYEEVSGLYEMKYDTIKGELEDVEVKFNIIAKRDKFEFVKKEFDVKYNLLDEINTHPALLDEKPCYIPSEKAYEIIRQYVISNLDGRYAQVTSNYDFHFEVKKKVKLAEPIPHTKNINENDRRKKPKWVTTYAENKLIPILNIKCSTKDTTYGTDCFVPQPFSGKDYEDMVNKMNKYLEDLIQEINTPYEECPHCKGMGVILSANNQTT
ncbi:MAG TPA: hypothetical protein GX708_17615 [Gallicola sp.]|nr:hypothetical protein [Gallicola sp.]